MRQYVCSECGTRFSITDWRFRCACGGSFNLEKEVYFPVDKISKRKPTLWRYREAIPIENSKSIISFDEGITPLVRWKYKHFNLLAKMDYIFPTGSFKDHGTTGLLSLLKEIGVKRFVEDSSGNAGASAAAYMSKGG